MHRFLSTWKTDLVSRVPLVLWAVLTVIVSLAGPFGTLEELRLFPRMLFWAIVIGATLFIGTGCRAFVQSVLGLTDFVRGVPMIAFLVSSICTWPIYIASSQIVPPGDPRTLGLGETALFIAAVSIGIGVFRAVLGKDELKLPAPVEAPAILPRLSDRLPPDMRGPLISISGRDHYVDVVTEAGLTTLLMRFADALAETDPADGTQIHRSHWVAWTAISAAGRKGTKVWVEVIGGKRLPVSQGHRAKLEERGLL